MSTVSQQGGSNARDVIFNHRFVHLVTKGVNLSTDFFLKTYLPVPSISYGLAVLPNESSPSENEFNRTLTHRVHGLVCTTKTRYERRMELLNSNRFCQIPYSRK